MKTNLIFFFLILIGVKDFAQKPELVVNTWHSEPVYDIAFDPSGEIFATCGWDKSIIIWDCKTGKKLRTLLGHNNVVNTLSFSSDGKYLASGGGEYRQDNTIRIWNPQNGELIKEIPSKTPDGIRLLQFTQSSNNLFISAGGNCQVVDIFSGKTISNKEIYSSRIFVNDGGYLLVENNKNLDVYEISSLKKIKEVTVANSLYETIIYYSSKKNVALVEVYSYSENKNKYNYLLRNLDTGKETNLLSGEMLNWQFAHDGSKALSSNKDEPVKVFDIPSGALLFSEKLELGGLISFSPDPNSIMYCTNTNQFVQLDLSTKRNIFTINGNRGRITSLDVSFENKYLACGLDNGLIRVWDLQSKKNYRYFKYHKEGISQINISQNGEYIAAASYDKTASIWRLSTGELTKTLNGHSDMLTTVKFSPDGRSLLTAGFDNLICEWDAITGNLNTKITGNKSIVASADFCNNQSLIISASKNGRIALWNKSAGSVKDEVTKSKYFINSLQLSRDKTVGACINGNNNDIDLYSCTDKLKQINKIKFPDSKSSVMYVTAVSVSPDNKHVAFSGRNGELHIAEVMSGKIIQSLNCISPAQSLKFTDDGKYLIAGCLDNRIIYWEVSSWKKIVTLFSISSTDWVAVTPDGSFDGTEEGIKMLHFVKGNSVVALEGYFEEFYTPGLLPLAMGGVLDKKMISVKEDIDFPPLVDIISTEKNENDGTISLTVQATDKGGGVDEVRLYHNGKLLNTTQRGFKPTGSTVKFDAILTPGENRFRAVGYSAKRTESSSNEVVVNYQNITNQKPNMHILAIGINAYLNPKYSLNFAKNDAEAFIQSLTMGAAPIFGTVNVTSFFDANATKEKIFSAIDKIKSTAKPEDVFVFYYAGHGVMSSGNETEISQFYLVPYDVTKMYEADEVLRKSGISAIEIGEFSRNIKAQKQLFVIDACQSGGAIQTLAMRGAVEEKAIAQLARSTGTYFIAASGTEQFATEVGELGHGIFTYSIIETLKGSCKLHDGKVTVNLLKSCVEDLVPELSKKHKGQPQFPTGYGFGMDFPIVVVK